MNIQYSKIYGTEFSHIHVVEAVEVVGEDLGFMHKGTTS
jgi:hypothetical protein